MFYILCGEKKKLRFLVILGTTLFALICFTIYSQQYLLIDDYFLKRSGEINNNSFNAISRIIYLSGDVYVAAPVVIVGLVWMMWRRYRQEAIAFAFATLGILIVVDRVLKPFFDRNRPPKPRLVEDVSRHSFPSGHAAGNLVLYFYLSFIIATKYPQLKVYVYAVSTILIIAIGFASVYTKAHWLTDVLAGYIFGYLWLIISLNLLKLMQNPKPCSHRKQ